MSEKTGDPKFAANLRKAREKRGWTQEQLAENSGISVVTIQKYESAVRYGKKEYHEKIAQALDISLSELLYGLKEEQSPASTSSVVNTDEPEYLAFLSVDPNLPESERELISDIIRRRYAEAKRNAEELSKIPPGINRPARKIKPE